MKRQDQSELEALVLSIDVVDSRKARKAFIALPYRLRRTYPNWVLPFRIQVDEVLDAKKNPFFDHGSIQLFIARRGDKVVGRIAAILNPISDTTYNEKALHFGFFDCENDPEAACALFARIEDFGREIGVDCVRGPFSPSVHEEIGLQIGGFDKQNFVLIPANPDYYQELLEQAGYDKSVDLYCFRLQPKDFEQRLIDYAPKLKDRMGITVRQVTKKTLKDDQDQIELIYRDEWVDNWPWLAVTPREWKYLMLNLMKIVDLRGALVAEDENGTIVGFSFSIPDINKVFRTAPSGRLFPFGLIKLIWALKRHSFRDFRLMTMGMKKEWRGKGIDMLMHVEFGLMAQHYGLKTIELSQILESNRSTIRLAEIVGAQKAMTHRIYEKKMPSVLSTEETPTEV